MPNEPTVPATDTDQSTPAPAPAPAPESSDDARRPSDQLDKDQTSTETIPRKSSLF